MQMLFNSLMLMHNDLVVIALQITPNLYIGVCKSLHHMTEHALGFSSLKAAPVWCPKMDPAEEWEVE